MSASPAACTLVNVPTHNEADNIATLVTAIFQATPAVDILFVDDHSQDGTQDKITLMQHQYGPKVHLLSRAGKVDGGGTRHWSIARQCISKAGALYARWLLGLPIQDPTSGYNVWHRRVLEAIDFKAVQSEGYAFQIECKYRAYCAGFRFVETPIVFSDRRVGASKMSTRIVLEAVLRTWQLRCLRPRSLLSQKSTER